MKVDCEIRILLACYGVQRQNHEQDIQGGEKTGERMQIDRMDEFADQFQFSFSCLPGWLTLLRDFFVAGQIQFQMGEQATKGSRNKGAASTRRVASSDAYQRFQRTLAIR